MSNHIIGNHHEKQLIIKQLWFSSTLLPHSWSIMCASSSTRPAVSTATSTFPPPLKYWKLLGKSFRQQMLEYVSRRTSQNNVNPQFDQRGQVKHHRKVSRCFKSNLRVVRMLVISSSSLSLLLCWVYVALKASVISKL